MESETFLRTEMLSAVGLLSRSKMLSRTGHINFSGRIDSGRFLLSSRGVAAAFTEDTFAVVSNAGEVEEGSLDPGTAEIVQMHTVVYAARPDAGSVLHMHSPFLTAFALAHRPLPVAYEPLLRHGQLVEVPVMQWAPRGSDELAGYLAATIESNADTSSVLLANHGVLAFAGSPLAVAKLALVLEEAAELEMRAIVLGGAKALPGDAAEQVRIRDVRRQV